MNFSNLKEKKTINLAKFIINFDPYPKIEKEMYSMETRLKELFPDELIDTKVPENFDPSTARFILRDDKRKRFLEVAMDKAVFSLALTKDYSTDVQKGIEFFQEKANRVLQTMKDLIQPNIGIMSCQFNIVYSLMDMEIEDVHSYIANKFLKDDIERPQIFHFNIQYQKTKNITISYSVKAFETHHVEFQIKRSEGQSIFLKKLRKTDKEVTKTDQGIVVTLGVSTSDDLEFLEILDSDAFDQIFAESIKANNTLEAFLV